MGASPRRPRSLFDPLVVGAFTYTVEPWGDNDADAAGAYGFCSQHLQRIRICKGLSDQRSAEVLLHELLHALLDERGLSDFTEEDQERIASVVASGLTAAARHNPGLFSLLERLVGGAP